MAGKNDKWLMFRNYMHNELGITKEDIKEWIQDAIHQEVSNVVKQAYGKCDISEEIHRAIYETDYWKKGTFKSEVTTKAAKYIADKIELNIKQ